MAYADIGDVAAGNVITEAWGDQVRANFQAGVPDIFTTKGDIAAATAGDAAARVAVGADDSTLVAASGEAAGLVWQTQPAVRVYNDAALDPDPAGWWACTFNSERYDTDAMHSTVSNTHLLTVPAGGAGIYSIGACMEFATGIEANAASVVGLRFLLNGATVIAQDLRNHYRAETTNLAVSLVTEYALSAGQTLECHVYTSQDVNVSAAANYSPEFWARWERRP